MSCDKYQVPMNLGLGTLNTVPSAPCVKTTEYLLVSDTTSLVLQSSTDRFELVKMANLIRKAGGEVTIFKETKL